MTNHTSADAPLRLTIGRRLFYSHLLTALICGLGVGGYFYFTLQREVGEQLRLQSIAVAKLAAHALDGFAWSRLREPADQLRPDFRATLQQLERLREADPDLVGVYLIRRSDTEVQWVVGLGPAALQRRTGERLDADPRFPLAAFAAPVADLRLQPFGDELLIRGSAPLAASQGQLAVVLERRAEAAQRRLEEVRTHALLAFIVAVLLSFLISQLLARTARRVIARFVDAVRAIAEGKLEPRLQWPNEDEFSHLALAINDLAARLRTTSGEREQALIQLRNARDRLEQNVRERTQELEQLNKLLRQEAEQRSRLEAALAEAAATDPLTRLLNRRAMLELINHVEVQLKRQAKFCCFVVLDVDHFKKINDQYGHDMGDAVLRATADLLRSEIHGSEAAARWGGEEFLLLWPDTSLAAAEHRANRIRELFATKQLVPDGPAQVTVSIGIAEYTGLDSVDACLIRADRALYKAKQDGRNRVVVAN
jgi:diguanylate cyclase (GGDEF)-like protein